MVESRHGDSGGLTAKQVEARDVAHYNKIELLANEIEQMDLLSVKNPPEDKVVRWVNFKDATNLAQKKMLGYTLISDKQLKDWDVVCGKKEIHDLVLMWIHKERHEA